MKINFKSKFSSIRAILENFGRAILVPVTVIPILALIASIGYSGQAILASVYTNTKPPTWLSITVNAIKDLGMIAISNIDFLVAIGLAAGLAKSEKVSAALSGLMAYASIHLATNLMLKIVDPHMLEEPNLYGLKLRFGVMSFQYSAFGGMIAGIVGYLVHKHTYKLKFPEVLSFFGGPKFSPVASTLIGWVVGLYLGFIWTYINTGLKEIGNTWSKLNAFAPFLYGTTNRALNPFGLHHVVNYFLYYTEVGTSWTDKDGKLITGIYAVAIAKLGENVKLTAKDTWIINGTFPTNIFSLTGAALAMYFAIPKENRKVYGTGIISALLPSALSGATEPIEFTFLFTAPLLFVIHIFYTGFTYMFMYLCGFAQVSTRGSGIITWAIVNLINARNIQGFWGLFVIGPIMMVVYFTTFYFMIIKLDFKTPGRDGKTAKLISKKEYKQAKQLEKQTDIKQKETKKDDIDDEFINNIIIGCGGKENIQIMANCVTRLRVTMYDVKKFDKSIVDKTKPYGYKEISNQVQIIYGPKVTTIATLVREKLGIES
ncbi:PTS transporter subunit EIIC [Mycoplasma feriruminatoris]|uniref:PTS sugar transporter subunit IIC n=1 Tax=Mycoplasma feriruminatoris TaxID=1179777 RepID=A0AAX3TG25_9MOLU|nr:PTS transporter subunit EIIC [Mycoplasma feriruminatoris]WFQ93091.1 PTS system glucose-specific EIICBA component [Mycoplasma feriruminatoris]WFQ93927.1 PTS sugar transporter subunit IIC [Mycoplasma feriruminatoris]